MTALVADKPEVLAIASDADVVRVRQSVRAHAIAARLSLVDQTKLVTAASELARNVLNHGGGGCVSVALVGAEGRTGVRATFSDEGPGIEDIDLALTDGWSSKGGLGHGLPGARRLVDVFELTTLSGQGTSVLIVKWSR
jgi:serine/threonine-protein kinase RsbT